MTAPQTTRAGRSTATLLPAPRPTRAERWEADLLRLPAGSGRTLVAGGKVTAGVFEWCIPTLPAVD